MAEQRDGDPAERGKVRWRRSEVEDVMLMLMFREKEKKHITEKKREVNCSLT